MGILTIGVHAVGSAGSPTRAALSFVCPEHAHKPEDVGSAVLWQSRRTGAEMSARLSVCLSVLHLVARTNLRNSLTGPAMARRTPGYQSKIRRSETALIGERLTSLPAPAGRNVREFNL